MSDEYGREEGRHHHRHHRENEEYDNAPPRRQEQDSEYGYQERPQSYGGQQPHGGGRPVVETATYEQTYENEQGVATSRVQVTKHNKEEKIAGFGGLIAGAAALYERHEVKKDPEHAGRHKLEEEIFGGGAVGAEGFALYEHHEKKKGEHSLDKYEKKIVEEEGDGTKKHGWFG